MKQAIVPGISIPQILIPRRDVDLQKWAVIACDQYTSQPEYWQRVEAFVGNSPSTYHLILPEVYLGTPAESARIAKVNQAMQQTLAGGFLVQHNGPVYVERTIEGKTRHGLMLCLDLEQYDYQKGSQTIIRATEGTILDQLPPRIRIREKALLEIPHILALIDDPQGTVIELITAKKPRLPILYDFDLMEGSGHLSGYGLAGPEIQQSMLMALSDLADPNTFQRKYGVGPEKKPLLVAIGDGNHSLASAKAFWEKIKPLTGLDHPARYALVEIENIHDEGLEFKPIHRLLFDIHQDPIQAFSDFYGGRLKILSSQALHEMIQTVDSCQGPEQKIGIVSPAGYQVAELSEPTSNLAVGSLQAFLDNFMGHDGAAKLDYVHGQEVIADLGLKSGNIGFYLPAMKKSDLFRTVILDGVLPRKTFSMGEAREKRFYMECRRIVQG